MQSLHPKAYGSIVQSAKLAVKFPARCGQGAKLRGSIRVMKRPMYYLVEESGMSKRMFVI